MAQKLSVVLREFLKNAQGKHVSLTHLRKELKIKPESPAWDGIRVLMHRLVQEKVVKPSGKNDGTFKVITEVQPVVVFEAERRPPIAINFPRDYNTQDQIPIYSELILREGDLILISGQSNAGKTALCINLCAENLESHPVLMGNEYTTLDGEPSSRFLNRLDAMDWVKWHDGEGDRFTLLPVRSDYAEHIVKDKINIIDWINIETGEHFLISNIMEDIKKELGRGIAIIAIQKAEGADSGRGGQFTKDFADVELLIDKFGDREVLLRIGKVKESKSPLFNRGFAYRIEQGVKIVDLREVVKCGECFGKGWRYNKPCTPCGTRGWIDKITRDYTEPDEDIDL